MDKRLSSAVLFILFFTAIAGCTGGRGNIKLETLEYPASLSSALYGEDFVILTGDDELIVVDDFFYEKRFWSVLYSGVLLNGDKDIAEAINKGIDEAQGDGMINMTVTSSQCFMNLPSYLFFLHVLPITPGCVNVTVEGQIVKVKGEQVQARDL